MKKLTTALLSIIFGLLIGAIILKLSGISPIDAFEVIIEGAFKRPNYISYIIIKSTPLILTGLSVAFAFKTGLFNIGAEGQFIVGAMSAAIFGLAFNFPPYIQIPLVFILSTLMAALYGGLSGFLKARFGVHEVLSTIMLNWIALYVSNFVVFLEKMRRPHMETTEFINPSTSTTFFGEWKITDAGIEWLNQHEFLRLFLRPPLNGGIFVALISVLIVWFILNKTVFGKKLKAVGFAPKACDYAGINTKLKITQSMMISGALAGMAGVTHVMGVSKNISVLSAFEGYGFDGIDVSLIGANHPVGVLFSGFFLGMLKYAGQKIQPHLDAPGELIGIVIGIIVFITAMPELFDIIRNKLRGNK